MPKPGPRAGAPDLEAGAQRAASLTSQPNGATSESLVGSWVFGSLGPLVASLRRSHGRVTRGRDH